MTRDSKAEEGFRNKARDTETTRGGVDSAGEEREGGNLCTDSSYTELDGRKPAPQDLSRPPRPPGSIKQRRREKRKAGWVAKKALAKEKRREERQRREEALRQEGIEIRQNGTDYRDLPKEQWSVSQKVRNAKRREFEALVKEGGYRVCVDMSFHEVMAVKARSSLVQQILYLYGCNRKATQPCLVTLSGIEPAMTQAVKKLQGFETWLGVTTAPRCYMELFPKGDLVYLTADSPNTISRLDREKVYIIGGLVDRNAQKGLCLEKANSQGIATAKLPLKKEDVRGSHSRVLAVNHVFEILVRAMESQGDLQKIEERQLPPRKRPGWTGGDDRSDPKISSERGPATTKCFSGEDSAAEESENASYSGEETAGASTERVVENKMASIKNQGKNWEGAPSNEGSCTSRSNAGVDMGERLREATSSKRTGEGANAGAGAGPKRAKASDSDGSNDEGAS